MPRATTLACCLLAGLSWSCGKDEPTTGGYGSDCSTDQDCESALCVGGLCSQDCSAAACPNNDACLAAATGKACSPGTPGCNSTCSGSINGVPYDLKCGESSSCLSGKKLTCTAAGIKEEPCGQACTCNTSASCQAGCSCDPDCPPIATVKKWGEACSCGAGHDGQTLFCSGTDPERCGMKLSDPNVSRWGCFWTGASGICTYKCASTGVECPDSAACNSFPSSTGTWKICAAP